MHTRFISGPSDPIERGGGGGGGGGKSHSSSKATKRCTSAGPYAKDDNNGSGDVVDRCRSPVTENVRQACGQLFVAVANLASVCALCALCFAELIAFPVQFVCDC